MTKHVKDTEQPVMSNKTFDFLRAIAQYWLPGLGALYFALAQVWGLPYAEQVVGTVVALDTFLGVVLGYTRKKYEDSPAAYDGSLVVSTPSEHRVLYSFEPTVPVEDIAEMDKLVLKVENPDLSESRE